MSGSIGIPRSCGLGMRPQVTREKASVPPPVWPGNEAPGHTGEGKCSFPRVTWEWGPRSHGGRQVFLPPCDLGMGLGVYTVPGGSESMAQLLYQTLTLSVLLDEREQVPAHKPVIINHR